MKPNLQKKNYIKYMQMYDNIKTITREFDPGSGLTLAAHIRHASRTNLTISLLVERLVADW